MTIAARNRLIKLGMLFSCLLSIISISIFIFICINPDSAGSGGERRFLTFPDFFLFDFNFYAATAGILAMTLLSTTTCFRMYFLFEKTTSIEITFFAAGIISISLESIRMMVPLYNLWQAQPLFIYIISRTVFFSRIFFILAVLAGAIFSFEKNFQQGGTALFSLVFLAFLTARFLPVNYSDSTSLFFLAPGYLNILIFLSCFMCVTAVISFIIQGITKNDKAYYTTAAGCTFMLTGWILLCLCDNWVFLCAGLILQILGTEKYLRSLHTYYMWQ